MLEGAALSAPKILGTRRRVSLHNKIVTTRVFWSHCAMEKFRPLLAEFVGTFALIFVGIGAIKTVVT